MTLHPRDLTSVPADTAALAEQLLPATNPYRVLGDHLADLFADIEFAPLYTSRGRAAISPSLLALVTLFQFLENVPDREAAEMVRVRVDWKYALHLPLADPGFDYTCLCYFRRRLLEHQQEGQLFEAVLQKVQAWGFLKKRGKQRTDALAVLGAVRQLSTLETVSETLRLALRALEAAAPVWVAARLPEDILEPYARSQPEYRLSAAEREAAVQDVGRWGFWLLDQLAARAPADLRQLEAVQTLGRSGSSAMSGWTAPSRSARPVCRAPSGSSPPTIRASELGKSGGTPGMETRRM